MKRVLAFPLVRLVLIVLLFGALATPFILVFHPPQASMGKKLNHSLYA